MKSDTVFIIAEAGVNHNGSIDMALELIRVAAQAGVDAVKFQTFKTENLVTKKAQKAPYQKRNTNSTENQFDMLKKLELSQNDYAVLMQECKKQKIEFLSTPFDLESIDFLAALGLAKFKVGSGEITNYPYLKKLGQLKKKIILSTGMSNLADIEAALNLLVESGTEKKNIYLLHANSEYPTPFQDVNLRAMKTMEQSFQVKVGYSDHTKGIEVPIAAAALGACILEKHFTLDSTLPGPDHKASLEPVELKEMVNAIRLIERALGDGIKKPSQSELPNISIARKSITAKTVINKGDLFSGENLTVKRPGTGISPMRWDEVIGQKATKDYGEDDIIDTL